MEKVVATVEVEGETYHYCCPLQYLEYKEKHTMEVDGRVFFVTRSRGTAYALDPRCYHAGGPLVEGKVQDIEDYTVLRCPWHDYKIVLTNGVGLFQDLSGTLKVKPGGQKQRLHKVALIDGDRGKDVYVRITTPEKDGDAFDCDKYAHLKK